MANYCTQVVKNDCPSNTFGPVNSCSGFVANSRAEICRDWANSANEKLVTVTQQRYCVNNRTPDCGCLNRFDDEDYQFLAQADAGPDYTWYRPCRDNRAYIIDPRTQKLACNSQPTSCDTFTNYFNSRDNYIEGSAGKQNLVKCKGKILTTDRAEPGSGTGDFFDRYAFIIILIIIILIAIMFYAYVKRLHRNKCIVEKSFNNC